MPPNIVHDAMCLVRHCLRVLASTALVGHCILVQCTLVVGMVLKMRQASSQRRLSWLGCSQTQRNVRGGGRWMWAQWWRCQQARVDLLSLNRLLQPSWYMYNSCCLCVCRPKLPPGFTPKSESEMRKQRLAKKAAAERRRRQRIKQEQLNFASRENRK